MVAFNVTLASAVVRSVRSCVPSEETQSTSVAGTISAIVEAAIERLWMTDGQLDDLRQHVEQSEEDTDLTSTFLICAKEAHATAERELVNLLLVLFGARNDQPRGVMDEDSAYVVIEESPGAHSLLVVDLDAIDELHVEGPAFDGSNGFAGDPAVN